LVNPAASQGKAIGKLSNNAGDGHQAFHLE
jgi:hypothetical protein